MPNLRVLCPVSLDFFEKKKGSSLDRPEKHNKQKEMRKKGLSRRLVPTPDGKQKYSFFVIFFFLFSRV